MRRSYACASGIGLVAVMMAAAAPADADGTWPPKPIPLHTTLKLGVYSPESANDGIFAGLELGPSVSSLFEGALTLDYFHHSNEIPAGPAEDVENPYGIPIDESSTGTKSSVHLGMLGLLGRLRMPLGRVGPVPFIQGGATVQLLHLTYTDNPEGGTYPDDAINRSDTFAGIGWFVGGGVEQPIDSRLSFVGEFGYNHAEPSKDIEQRGLPPVTLTAHADGVYLRAGLRFLHN